jgi:hypothetical protein
MTGMGVVLAVGLAAVLVVLRLGLLVGCLPCDTSKPSSAALAQKHDGSTGGAVIPDPDTSLYPTEPPLTPEDRERLLQEKHRRQIWTPQSPADGRQPHRW